MHEAEQYLRNPETPYSLYIQYQGRRRRLFYNRDQNICGIIGIGRRRYGFGFGDWDNIEKIFKPAPDKDPEEINRRLIRKFQREAAKAGFTSPLSAQRSLFPRLLFCCLSGAKRGKPTVYHHFAKALTDSPNRKRKASRRKPLGGKKVGRADLGFRKRDCHLFSPQCIVLLHFTPQ